MKDNSSNKNEITAIIPSILYANRCDYLFGSDIVFQTQTCLRIKFWLEDTATMIR